MDRALIIAAALVIAALALGGRYSVVAVGGGGTPSYAFIVDRFTGSVTMCMGYTCGPTGPSSSGN